MKLSLKNIGKIETASVEINGITVIAGENNTGKSTVGRALFAVFNSFYNIQKQIESERVQNIENLIDIMYRNVTNRYTRRFDSGEIAQKIVAQIYLYKDDTEAVKDIIVKNILQYDENFEKHIDDNSIDEYIVRIKDGLNVADLDIFKSVLEKKLDAEFAGEVNNIFTDKTGEIVLSIKDTNIIVTIEDNAVKSVVGKIDLHTQTVYIDDPFVIDEVRYTYGIDNSSLDHRGYLREKLNKENNANLIDEIIASNKLDNIYRKISTVISGDIVKNKRSGLGYQRKNTDKVLDVKNLSTGFKTFAILKTLLMNSTIEYNGKIILDEPEIHLHPEWQLLFAELIVLIQKEFGVHILLNTHSPYFLNAIEVYAVKYGINDRCKYYLASSQDDISTIGDVTNNIELIYSKLARPLQELENEIGRL
ncbi:MAG: AAA family ATPase [Eisenbergiella massiliensis]